MELLVFFFQAEDGIRDYKVTGVQTCALPISSIISAGRDDRGYTDSTARSGNTPATLLRRPMAPQSDRSVRQALPTDRPSADRSEERRVGKGGGQREEGRGCGRRGEV